MSTECMTDLYFGFRDRELYRMKLVGIEKYQLVFLFSKNFFIG